MSPTNCQSTPDACPICLVQAVVPYNPKAEQMRLMMNKNFPAYITFVIKDQGGTEGIFRAFRGQRSIFCLQNASLALYRWPGKIIPWPSPPRSPSPHCFLSTMAEAKAPPPIATPILPFPTVTAKLSWLQAATLPSTFCRVSYGQGPIFRPTEGGLS
jgi:hypothetical protein